MRDDLAELCRSCGMCCDGSLFGRVPLAPEEIATARQNRLRLVRDERAFDQPCTALAPIEGERRACTAYEERPRACRAFVCKLHEAHRRDGGPLEPRLAIVHRARTLLATADPSRPVDPELAQLMEHFERA